MKKYQPQEFEKKWIDWWDKEKTYKVNSSWPGHEPRATSRAPKMYVLDMFPYPSGDGLHVGHPRGYTATDIIARFYRMSGYSVLHPMGWDAFGLPAENAAIKAKKNPMDMVPLNIATFKRQMKMLGFSYDWDRELATTDPNYYGVTQKLFIEFFKAGLLFKKNTPVYFCEVCKTGLAEEEVLANGTHERCGSPITKKELPQWIFRITTYAESLLDGLKELKWPTGILEMQRNWIGRKEGINIYYEIKGIKEAIICFTTRPDTNFGATFIVLAPEHEFVKKIIKGELDVSPTTKEEVVQYVKTSLGKTDVERQEEGRKKTGAFTGFYAVNNLSGKLMPVWVSDFVLSSFGTGAVVGVPGHDLRDFEFAKQFNIEIIRVVVGKDGDSSPVEKKEQVQEEEGTMVNSEFLNGLDIHKATTVMMNHLEEKGWGKRAVTYHLRDWIFSRQRYWGEPIPMVYCNICAKNKISYSFSKPRAIHYEAPVDMYGWFPLKEKELPLKLPYVDSYEPTGTGESPLGRIPSFVKTKCPNCGSRAAVRETDTMPNWAGSCWYFLAFAFWNENNNKYGQDIVLSLQKKQIQNWLPVDWYVGGAEHAVLHLLYARFWMHVLNDMGFIDFREPFIRLRNVGMILAEDHRKMSKSLGNVINPDEVVAEYGADALRMYEMFMAPFSQEIAWSTTALHGTHRFLRRVWESFQTISLTPEVRLEDKNLLSKLNKTIKKVGEDIVEFKFNTAIAAMMEFINEWEAVSHRSKVGSLKLDDAKKFLKILAPFAPFMTEEIWQNVLFEKGSVHLSPWPLVDKRAFVAEAVKIAIQVNGKVRAVIEVDGKTGSNQEDVVSLALESENVKKHVGRKKYKVIYVQGRVLNFVLS